MSLIRTVEPTEEPISLTEAKAHLRVDITDDDALISSLIVAARENAEQYLWRALCTQTWRYTLDMFPQKYNETPKIIKLPYPRLQSISSFTYFDTSGTEQTMVEGADYLLDGDDEPARLASIPNKDWPISQTDRINAVSITYVCGYGAATDVPGAIKSGMKLLIGHLYENREAVVSGNMVELPMAVQWLWQPFRAWRHT